MVGGDKGPILDKDRLLKSIFRISGLLTIQAELNDVLATILDELVETIGFDQGCILLLDETEKRLKVRVVKNYTPEEEERARSLSLNLEKQDSLATRVFRSGRAVAIGGGVVTDEEGISGLDKVSSRMARGAIICAPLKAGEGVMGVIAVWCEREVKFFPEEIKMFLALTHQMSIVIQNAHLFHQNKKKIARLVALENAVSAMNVNYENSHEILAIAVRAARDMAGAEKAMAVIWSPGEGKGVVSDGQSAEVKDLSEIEGMLAGTMAWEALSKGITLGCAKINTPFPPLFPGYPVELAVPILVKDRYQGIFLLAKKEGTFDADQVNVIDILVKNCAVFYENSVMHALLYAEAESLKSEVRKLKEREDELLGFHDILGRSPKMVEIFHVIAEIADHNTNVLIQGESGTGKELIARAIHRHSLRSAKPFVDLNCAAIPANLLESELFGYEAGAFTDAKKRKIGLLEYAAGGTVLLDEIGEMPLHLQAKFLRMLEDGYVRRLGGAEKIPIDVRFIFSTNRDLSTMVAAGQFREDLLYRIRVVPIMIPPLRERPEDIILLARHFVDEFNRKFKKSIEGFSPEAEQILMGYKWPGNVRELRNIVERIMILKSKGNVITPEDIPAEILSSVHQASDFNIEPLIQQLPISGINYDHLTDKINAAVKRRILSRALDLSGGNKSRAARMLGISRYKLIREEKKLSLES
ncbi:MAG TPA: sigma-54-dependent Fis family transcriptional regulator [Syntrophales bacterium]|nr:sigma-54-dependent Fis family transcriptional regulator [Syntrophales bacterium]HOL59265.1 sigma-54-dependent Fis family transcriptional regulator [Syntrophales bacterium]HPO35315.1 sigma-54-dependent Fis family transcriptional regulator [Syntrophales bacterium]